MTMMTRLVYSCTLGVLALGLSGCSFFTSFDEFEQQPDGSVDANVPDMTVDAGPQVDTPTEFYLEFSSRLCAFVRRCEAKVPELRPIGQGYCLPPNLLTGLVPGEFAGTDLEGYSPLDALSVARGDRRCRRHVRPGGLDLQRELHWPVPGTPYQR
jgi:hypothetical protein